MASFLRLTLRGQGLPGSDILVNAPCRSMRFVKHGDDAAIYLTAR